MPVDHKVIPSEISFVIRPTISGPGFISSSPEQPLPLVHKLRYCDLISILEHSNVSDSIRIDVKCVAVYRTSVLTNGMGWDGTAVQVNAIRVINNNKRITTKAKNTSINGWDDTYLHIRMKWKT